MTWTAINNIMLSYQFKPGRQMIKFHFCFINLPGVGLMTE